MPTKYPKQASVASTITKRPTDGAVLARYLQFMLAHRATWKKKPANENGRVNRNCKLGRDKEIKRNNESFRAIII